MIREIVALLIMCSWGMVLMLHARRLLRLAQVRAPALWHAPQLRERLSRVWWWLSRVEFWRPMLIDCWRCAQLTMMLLLLLWGATT